MKFTYIILFYKFTRAICNSNTYICITIRYIHVNKWSRLVNQAKTATNQISGLVFQFLSFTFGSFI